MVSTLPAAPKSAVEETLLTPRFYTTDFDKAAEMDLSEGETELQAMLTEMRADYNRHHFVRNEAFKQQNWDHIQGAERQAFVDYLERSCVSEFSGFCCSRSCPASSRAATRSWRKCLG